MTRCTCEQAVRDATALLRAEIERLRSRLEQAHQRAYELEEAFARFDNDDCTPEEADEDFGAVPVQAQGDPA